MIARFPVSPEQEEVIADHLLLGHELGVQPDERAWIQAQVQRAYPGMHITKAELDMAEAYWMVELSRL